MKENIFGKDINECEALMTDLGEAGTVGNNCINGCTKKSVRNSMK